MTNLWEYDINNPKECDVCTFDTGYVMPLKNEGVISLTFDVFANTTLGGIPLDTKLYRTDLLGNIVEDLGGINTFNGMSIMFGDATKGRLDIFIPAPCGNGSDAFTALYQSQIATGTIGATAIVEIGTLGPTPFTVEFTIGDPAPWPVYQIGPNAYIINDQYQGTILTAGLVFVDNMFSVQKTDVIGCHRYMLELPDGSGGTLEFYTVPFQCDKCSDGVVELEGVYPLNQIDCEDQIQTVSSPLGPTPPVDGQLTHRLCVYGYTKKRQPKLTLNYSENCFHNSSSKVDRFQLLGRAIPSWLQNDMAAVLMAKTLFVDNVELMVDGETFTEEQEIEMADFQNINLALRTCDCTLNFVC